LAPTVDALVAPDPLADEDAPAPVAVVAELEPLDPEALAVVVVDFAFDPAAVVVEDGDSSVAVVDVDDVEVDVDFASTVFASSVPAFLPHPAVDAASTTATTAATRRA
jgi:hypothetical protein